MDPITHCLTGAMAAKSFPLEESETASRKRVWFWSCVIAAELPDADFIFYPFTFLDHPFFYHRGFSHSFLGAILLGLIFASILRQWQIGYFLRFWGILTLSFCAHVFGDWFTSYGTPVLAPFSFKPYSLDLLSNLTFIPMAIFAFSLFISRKTGRRGTIWILAGWTAFFIFLAASAMLKIKAFQISGENTIAALPDLIFPARWYTIKKSAELFSYETNAVNVLNGKADFIGKYPSLNLSGLQDIHPRVKKYLHFNRWPVLRMQGQKERSFIIGNLLYRGFGRGALSGALKIGINKDNKLYFERTTFLPE